MYEVVHHPATGKTIGVRRLSDGAQLNLNGSSPGLTEFLQWNAKQAKPLSLADVAPPEIPWDEKRRAAYQAETDPLLAEALYDKFELKDETKFNQWIAAVKAIKSRYPIQ
ncbi:MAG TPA: hypothetical protein VEK08_26985 [Planctomycetota bacterium]|nr:hypothetical protein [Planctomycetota bacterium]